MRVNAERYEMSVDERPNRSPILENPSAKNNTKELEALQRHGDSGESAQ